MAVQQLREERGLTHGEVAKPVRVSVRWLKQLEANELQANCSIRRLDQIADALGAELLDLYTRAGEMAGPPPWLKGKE
jgi:transcriptional regulator with XRE-family HTH domain